MADLLQADTSVDLQVLTGQVNYNQWSRNFKVKAIGKGVWKLYNGEQPIVTKPDQQAALTDPNAARRMTRAADEVLNSFDKVGAIAEYQLDLDEFHRYEGKVQIATELLSKAVDQSIRGNLLEHSDPKAAWDWLKSHYKMNDKRALDLALNKIESYKLRDHKSITDYLNAHQSTKLDIHEAGGQYTDDQLISKIIRGLPERYDTIIDQYYFSQDIDTIKDLELKDLTSRLLWFEAKIQHRAQKNPRSRKDEPRKAGDKSKGGKTEWGKQKRNEKCTYPKCGRWGHNIDECFIAHPELKKKPDNGNADTKPDNLRPMFRGHRYQNDDSAHGLQLPRYYLYPPCRAHRCRHEPTDN